MIWWFGDVVVLWWFGDLLVCWFAGLLFWLNSSSIDDPSVSIAIQNELFVSNRIRFGCRYPI